MKWLSIHFYLSILVSGCLSLIVSLYPVNSSAFCQKVENLSKSTQFSELEFLPNNTVEQSDFTEVVGIPLKDIWTIFTTSDVFERARSKLVQYSFQSMTESYANEAMVGDRFFFNMYLPFIPCSMPMGLVVTHIEPNVSIEFQYTKFSPAYGIQKISFIALSDEQTQIIHHTRYRGKNSLIHQFYAPFHRASLREFYDSLLEGFPRKSKGTLAQQ